MQYRIEVEMDKRMDEMEERKKKQKEIGLTGPGTCATNVEKKQVQKKGGYSLAARVN